ncbi:MAG: hybrid sensor histidine kinase/response regulator [Anaerolineae bacterium]|nr:hybrid sensor histidine kinase/response regulator [Anaerolineae bacterium]
MIILVVEDWAEAVVQDALEEVGYEVCIACSFEDVVGQARAHSLQAIVVDLLMTGIDGLAMCRDLRRHPLTAQVPIIAVVEAGSAARRADARAAGADVCLPRPLDWADLQYHLHRLAQRDRSEADGALLSLKTMPRDEAEGLMDMLAHDLRSPTVSVVNGLSLLIEAVDERDRLEMEKRLKYALMSARRQLRALDELLNMVRLESDLLSVNIEAVDVAAVVREVLAEMYDALASKGLCVVDEIPAGLPEAAADVELLRQAVRTLLDNSIKFCAQDDRLTIRACAGEAGRLTITWTDTGRAVMPDSLDEIFDLFAQWRVRQRGSRTSVAWGLPFCRSALRVMHGDIHAEPAADGVHTAFIITLPVYT